MRPFTVFLVLAFLAAIASASTYNGDGTYKMYISDTVVSSNDFDVVLRNLSAHYNQRQQLVIDTAIYDIYRDGLLLTIFTLKEGQSEKTSIESGTKNLTVTLEALGVDPSPKTVTAYIPPRPYANTTVESETYIPPPPPPPDVEVTYVQAHPDKFYANISWATNTSANATLLIYNKTSASPFKVVGVSGFDNFHEVKVTGLKSDTNYDAIVNACTENSCVDSYTKPFKTLPVTPVISDVAVAGTTNDSAVITWKTDVVSDSRVYYRKMGTSEWTAVPPKLSWVLIKKFYIFNFSESDKEPQNSVVSLSGKTGTAQSASLAPITIKTLDISDSISLPGDYTIKSDIFSGGLFDIDAIKAIIKQSHSIKLYDLEPETTYQFKVSSCADRCVNSSIGTFETVFTVKTPYANIVSSPSSLNHGTSAILLLSAYSRNPKGHLTNVKVEWNDGGSKVLHPKFGGDSKSFISNSWPTLSVISLTFRNSGNHQIKLTVTDNYSKTSTDTVNINVNSKTKCTSTSAKYYPTDTPCTNKWPNNGGAGINYNNGIGACHAFEVCDNNLDYMIADAESCCNGERSYSSNPTKNRGYNYDKNAACNSAITNTRNKGPLSSLTSKSSMKLCKASYLVYAIGSKAVYVKDYYTAEACCKDVGSICGSYPRFQSWNPWPAANIKYNELWCYWNDYWIFGKYPKDGWYGSDTNPESNNNALADFPAHATVNTMNTGTCVDYSFVVTTALRKAGFGKNEIMSMRTPGHLYNVVWLPGDSKYSFIDTVGNNGGDFFTGPGWSWESGGHTRDHCGYNSDKCSNDNGMKNCPSKSQVYGC